jgi:hypothetical protein
MVVVLLPSSPSPASAVSTRGCGVSLYVSGCGARYRRTGRRRARPRSAEDVNPPPSWPSAVPASSTATSPPSTSLDPDSPSEVEQRWRRQFQHPPVVIDSPFRTVADPIAAYVQERLRVPPTDRGDRARDRRPGVVRPPAQNQASGCRRCSRRTPVASRSLFQPGSPAGPGEGLTAAATVRTSARCAPPRRCGR